MYQWNAKEYLNHSDNQKRWAKGLLSRIDFHGDENVLDVGCGDGQITCRITEKVPRGKVLGIDESGDMIALARGMFRQKSRNLSFAKKDACRLGFTNRFDLAFSNSCFHWIANHDSLLASIYRALKPGGRLFVQMGAKGNFSGLTQTASKLMARKKWRGYFGDFHFPFYFFSTSAYKNRLTRAGFKIKTIRTFAICMEYDNLKAFKASLRTIWMPYLEKVPGALREIFLSETVEQYLNDYPSGTKGWVRVKMKRLEFCAQKKESGHSVPRHS